MADAPVYTFDIGRVYWTPAGPPEDRECHLMALVFFGKCPMVLHAVQVLVSRDHELITKCEKLQHLIFGAEVVAGGPSLFRRVLINGLDYVLIAIPTVDGRQQ